MLDNEKWMLETQAKLFSRYYEFKPWLDSGVFYGYQRDKAGRPCMYVNLKKAFDDVKELDKFLDLADFMASYMQYHSLVPGKVETWNMIVDFKDVGLG